MGPPDASQEQMRAAFQQASKLAGLSSVGESQPPGASKTQQPAPHKEAPAPEPRQSSSKPLGVTSIKRHSTQPIAMLSFTQDEYAEAILEKKPAAIKGITVT